MLNKKYIIIILIFIYNFIFSNIEKITNGLTYELIKIQDIVIHELIVDPKLIKIVLNQAHENNFQAQKVTDIVKKNNALVGINAGFFTFGKQSQFEDIFIRVSNSININLNYQAFPLFNLKIKDKWFSLTSKNTGVIAWQEDNNNIVIDTLAIKWRLKLGDLIYPINNINKPFAAGPVLYTPAYGSLTPPKKNAIEIIIVDNKIIKIDKDHGRNHIPENGFVYVINKKFGSSLKINKITVGDKANLLKKFTSDLDVDWETYDFILGSTPLLIKNGKVQEIVIKANSSFYKKTHARTAVGILPDNKLLFVCVDKSAQSKGITLLDLANYFLSRNCKSALNLDGGDSSTLVINNQITNNISFNKWGKYLDNNTERPVGSSFLLFAK